jgi:glycosyltransferase involved in cell wall biosynthesis
MTDLPSISVVIPTFNRAEVVESTLQYLIAQDYPPGLVEILVVDNSSDSTPDMVKRLAADTVAAGGPAVELLSRDERLPAVKRNIGLRAARGDLVLFMNDDLWLEPQALASHAATHREAGEPVAVLGRCEQSARMPWTPFVDFYQPFAYHLIAGLDDRQLPYQFFWSMNLSLPRKVMLDRNLVFHEDWRHIGQEDIELGWRWTQAGLRLLYAPEANGEHYHPHTVVSACRLQESIGRGLRDLEALVDDPTMADRYGVRHRTNRPATYFRFLLRDCLFNTRTAPTLAAWLDRRMKRSALTDWLYWKVLMHYTGVGYRAETPRPLTPVPTVRVPA